MAILIRIFDAVYGSKKGNNREMVWLFIHTPTHLVCVIWRGYENTGGSSKEGSKNNHRIQNKPTSA